MSITEAEAEESKMFWETYAKFTQYISEKTNVTVLRHERAEADDMIARWIHMHPADSHWIISTDSDFQQLVAPNVKIYNGVTNELITLQGYLKENGKPVLDKKTKEPKLLEDPEYILFRKICRGDPGDNIFAAYPGAREKGTKNKVGILEAFQDRHKMGYNHNNFMLSRWIDHEGNEIRVRDAFERNRGLIDLTAQPQEIKDAVDQRIRESVRVGTTPHVGIHFMKFCGRYDLVKLSSQADSYATWLNAPYKGSLV
jgi:5'-3' exonuclease